MDILYTAFYVFVLAVTLASLEIQIEGKHGWAQDLPTWRPHKKSWYTKTFTKLSQGKLLTGYHIIFFLLIFLIFHLPFVFGFPFTFENWLRALSLMLFLMVLEDFIWFIINPHYGIKKFFSNEVPWHKKRFLHFPPDYTIFLSLSLLVILPIYFGYDSFEVIWWWGTNFLIFLLFLMILILIDLLRQYFIAKKL